MFAGDGKEIRGVGSAQKCDNLPRHLDTLQLSSGNDLQESTCERNRGIDIERSMSPENDIRRVILNFLFKYINKK